GGFIYADGNNGSSIGGRRYEPLKDGLATMIAYRDGRVDVRAWHGGPVAGPQIAFARQSLPLIVDHGRLSPALNDSSRWGFTLGNAVRVWRTGAGIDRHGNLIYAAADFQTVETLARILKRAGAVRAMQLDINPEWPTLITYTHHGGLRRARERGIESVGDEVEGRSAGHLDRHVLMVREDKDRSVVRGVIAPPPAPVPLPWAADRSKHVAAHHVRAARTQQQVAHPTV